MRPIALSIEGLTAFADATTVDFTDLQLFAITGTTGAGKSTLIDAMLLALFGKVPRTGLQHGQLIALGKDQINVLFEFAARGERYRVARTIRRQGASKVHLERVTANGPQPLAGKARDVEAEIERILGIDYDAFTRSVVLPQGQFDAFLRGDKAERRKILVNLLSLSHYERMAGLCGDRQRQAQADASSLQQRLRSDFAQATPEHLAHLREKHAALAQERQRLAALAAALVELQRLAGEADAARKQLAAQQARRGGLLRQEAEAKQRLQGLERAAATFAAERSRLEAAIAAALTEPDRTAALQQAAPLLQQLLRALGDRPALQRDATTQATRRQQFQQELEAASALLPTLRAQEQAQREELAAAEAEREAQLRADAAQHLRHSLHAGEPCPVCEQTVAAVPAATPIDVEAQTARVATQKTLWANAQKKLHDAERAQQQRQDDLPQAQTAERDSKERLRRADDDIAQAVQALQALGVTFSAPPTAAAATERQRALAKELAAAQAAAQQRQQLHAQLEALLQQHRDAGTALAVATGQQQAVTAQLAQLDRELAAVAAAADTAARALADAAAAADLDAGGEDATPRLLQLAKSNATAQQQVSVTFGQLTAECTAVEQAILRATELRAELGAAEARAALLRDLALLLRGDHFQDFVLTTAMQRLCRDGSERLRTLSGGRYALQHDGSDFVVVDHWNAGRERSVRTLSGGETFLASLALALALADSIRSFAAPDGSASALDCLFVDEGFGALDGDALEAAVQALETLHGGQRMVGVITHLQALAERLPARLHVENRAGRARVIAS